ncbi:hypothetical protein [Salisediminibacterium beveridgei]|uniref:hypothetical protein n=1 Tax=Salisediminibacterium beveridgei TaxID=632773 RepID=UPI0012EEAE17|nr:hypothetical protein [Salisediminibacterium beveridgei]
MAVNQSGVSLLIGEMFQALFGCHPPSGFISVKRGSEVMPLTLLSVSKNKKGSGHHEWV